MPWKVSGLCDQAILFLGIFTIETDNLNKTMYKNGVGKLFITGKKNLYAQQ